MLERLKRFYGDHTALVNLLLVALILRLVYLNAVSAFVFDESFYVPAARSILVNATDINPEHPPLVKLVLAGSIAVFGDNPIGWRIPSVVAGLASVVFLYFIALKLSGNRSFAALSAALLALDPLHVLLSRLAMLDIFMLAFALAGSYFMLRNYMTAHQVADMEHKLCSMREDAKHLHWRQKKNQMTAHQSAKQQKRNFILGGFLFGLAMASKWPAVLALLAVTAFLWTQKKLEPRDFARVILFAGLAYLLVSLPFMLPDPVAWLSSQIHNIGKMASLPAVAPQPSNAVEWLYLQKPVWFLWSRVNATMPADMLWLTNLLGGTPAFALIALGNPAFWIPGLLALAWLALNKTRNVSVIRKFSLIWFACTYIPFLLIPRANMFIYYMLPVLPAYALALSQFLVQKRLVKWYLVILAVFLALLLPFSIGLPIPDNYFGFLSPLIGSSITINIGFAQ